ncbi:MAG: DUF2339 domain-containing protein [Paludibacteraceae bacterium]|nr:DUF2339 domain-containing protein [Paludibacteraceae bacterium]
MVDNDSKINQLLDKLEFLQRRHDDFSKEISTLRAEIIRLKTFEAEQTTESEGAELSHPVAADSEIEKENNAVESQATVEFSQTEQPKLIINKSSRGKFDIEKFIGENIISKIGIAIIVIGVAIGTKYSIENDLISPLTRIILGYMSGLGLLGFGIRLKAKYENYSAVLVSGAITIVYFVTYFAYGLYNLIPQMLAFALMLLFTVFAVVAAVNYNRQIIAHIGLVGAYAVPFMLSDGSGDVAALFTYMTIINIGILAIALKKYWKPLYYVSFAFTWIIVYSWYNADFQYSDFGLTLIFISLFFAIFYLTFLAYKLFHKEKFVIDDIVLLIINSFVFYGMGYSVLNNHQMGKQLLGVFTVVNALVHFIMSLIIYRQKLADKNIHYLITGLVLVFITIAIPVQLDGGWVTLMWAGEAALLFWIGRTKGVAFYEKHSYYLMLLAFFSILQDWVSLYQYNSEMISSRITFIFNVNFLVSILFVAAFAIINVVNQKKINSSCQETSQGIFKIFRFLMPAILIFTVYYAFRIEIANYWNQLYADSVIESFSEGQESPMCIKNVDLLSFKSIWIINYSLLFVSVLTIVNLKKMRNQQLGLINVGLTVLVIVVFLTQGLYVLSELRESYLEQSLSHFYKIGTANLWVRYISFLSVALSIYCTYRYIKENFVQDNLKLMLEFFLHVTVLWIASSELINWMDLFRSEQSYKLGLSILWGVYSLFLIALGIWKKNKPMRIGAISLFGITLLKLFFYDISHLDTVAKTIVFLSLGVLLLVISFLYAKCKNLMSDNEDSN